MCVNLRRFVLKSGLETEVPCHCCWQCRADKVRNWQGKCLAEAQTSVDVDFVTLTYADVESPEAHRIKEPVPVGYAKELHYEDVQKWLKRIRKAGHKVRYVCAGEYGERKGRAHWHVILFWQGKRPERFAWKKDHPKKFFGSYLLYGNEWQDEFWHHGHVNYQPFTPEAAKYVCKYLLKWDSKEEPERKTKFNYSARPGIGFNWICDHWAQLHVDRRLAPQTAKYSFPHVLRNGARIDFKMTPHCATKFVLEFERRYYERWGDHPPSSDFCTKVTDNVALRLVSDALERRKYMPLPYDDPPGSGKVYFDEKLNAYFYLFGDNPDWNVKFYWSFDEKGRRSWQKKLVTEREARQREAKAFADELQARARPTRTYARPPRPAGVAMTF